MNMAKITSLTGANKVSIGDNVYKSLGRRERISGVTNIWQSMEIYWLRD